MHQLATVLNYSGLSVRKSPKNFTTYSHLRGSPEKLESRGYRLVKTEWS